MYNKKSYKIMVAFDIMTSIDKNFKYRYDHSEEMYEYLMKLVNDHDKIDNNSDIPWYQSFNNYLVQIVKKHGLTPEPI